MSGERGDHRATFAAVADRAARLAAGLDSLGVGSGDRVVMMNVNGQEYSEAYFACVILDAVFVPINYRVRVMELAWILGEVDARVVIAGQRYVELIDEARRLSNVAINGVVLGEAPRWEAYEATIASSAPIKRSPEGSDDDPTMIIFTSGTSARPKGVILRHASFCGFVMSNVTPADPDKETAETTILSVPLYHIAGAQALMAGIYGGRTLVLQPQFEPEGWLRLVERERVTRAMLAPTMLKSLMECGSFGTHDLASLRVITYGAATMPQSVLLEALERFPGVQFINAFGQTETAATITMLTPQDHVFDGTPQEIDTKRKRLRSIGRPLPDVEVRIVDESGNELPTGQTGEIVARGERLMKGYWNRPQATADVIRDGWLRTGDLAWRDQDGYIYLAGRAREFIKRGGEMISPEEVEEVLEMHPAVEEAAVIGLPDENWGEVVHAAVVPSPNASISGDELIEFCQERIASFKKPEAIHFVDELPRNQLGKVMRGELRERLRFASEEARSGSQRRRA